MIFPCAPCQTLYDGWVMYQKPASRWIQYNAPARSIEARKAQIADHYALINRQCAAIKDSCRRTCEHLEES